MEKTFSMPAKKTEISHAIALVAVLRAKIKNGYNWATIIALK